MFSNQPTARLFLTRHLKSLLAKTLGLFLKKSLSNELYLQELHRYTRLLQNFKIAANESEELFWRELSLNGRIKPNQRFHFPRPETTEAKLAFFEAATRQFDFHPLLLGKNLQDLSPGITKKVKRLDFGKGPLPTDIKTIFIDLYFEVSRDPLDMQHAIKSLWTYRSLKPTLSSAEKEWANLELSTLRLLQISAFFSLDSVSKDRKLGWGEGLKQKLSHSPRLLSFLAAFLEDPVGFMTLTQLPSWNILANGRRTPYQQLELQNLIATGYQDLEKNQLYGALPQKALAYSLSQKVLQFGVLIWALSMAYDEMIEVAAPPGALIGAETTMEKTTSVIRYWYDQVLITAGYEPTTSLPPENADAVNDMIELLTTPDLGEELDDGFDEF